MLQDLTNTWKAFSASCWLWKNFPGKMLSTCLKKWWLGRQEVRWIWQIRQNSVAQFVQLLKCLLCDLWSGVVVEKNLAHSFDQCLLQFLVYLIDLLSILLRYNGFARIEKALVDQMDQMGSRPPNSDHDLFWCKFSFGQCLRASSWSNHWAGHHWLSFKIQFSPLHVTTWKMVCCCVQ